METGEVGVVGAFVPTVNKPGQDSVTIHPNRAVENHVVDLIQIHRPVVVLLVCSSFKMLPTVLFIIVLQFQSMAYILLLQMVYFCCHLNICAMKLSCTKNVIA